jgi:hypothetical protein
MPEGIYGNTYEEILFEQKNWEFDKTVFPTWNNTLSYPSEIQIPQIALSSVQLDRHDSIVGEYDPVDRDIELLSKRVMKDIFDSSAAKATD